jgi:hypothetical protein
LFIEAGKTYEGYFFARSASAVSLVARVIDKQTNASIGSVVIPFAGGNWSRMNFSFTTTAGTECVDGTHDPSVECVRLFSVASS